MWLVYIVKCSDSTLYTGITNDIEARVYAHNHLSSGAKYTRTRRPVFLVHSEQYQTRSLAQKREIAIKNLTRIEKLNLITVE